MTGIIIDTPDLDAVAPKKAERSKKPRGKKVENVEKAVVAEDEVEIEEVEVGKVEVEAGRVEVEAGRAEDEKEEVLDVEKQLITVTPFEEDPVAFLGAFDVDVELDDIDVDELVFDISELIRTDQVTTTSSQTGREAHLYVAMLEERQRGDSVLSKFVPVFEARPKQILPDAEFLADCVKLNPPLKGSKRAAALRNRDRREVQAALHAMQFRHEQFDGDFIAERDSQSYSYDPNAYDEERSFLPEVLLGPSGDYAGDRVALCGFRSRNGSGKKKRRNVPSKIFDVGKYIADLDALQEGEKVVVFNWRSQSSTNVIARVIVPGAVFQTDDSRVINALAFEAFVFPSDTPKERLFRRKDLLGRDVVVMMSTKDALDDKLALIGKLLPNVRDRLLRMRSEGKVEYLPELLRDASCREARMYERLLPLAPLLRLRGGAAAKTKIKGKKSAKAEVGAFKAEAEAAGRSTIKAEAAERSFDKLTEWDRAYERMFESKTYNASAFERLFPKDTQEAAYRVALAEGRGLLAFDKTLTLLPALSAVAGYPDVANRAMLLSRGLSQPARVLYVEYPHVLALEFSNGRYGLLEALRVAEAADDEMPPAKPCACDPSRHKRSRAPFELEPWPRKGGDPSLIVRPRFDNGETLTELTDAFESEAQDHLLNYKPLKAAGAASAEYEFDAAFQPGAAACRLLLEAVGGLDVPHAVLDDAVRVIRAMRVKSAFLEAQAAKLSEAKQKNLRSTVQMFIRDMGSDRFPHEYGKDAREAIVAIEGLVRDNAAYANVLRNLDARSEAFHDYDVDADVCVRFAAMLVCTVQAMLPFSAFHEPSACRSREGRVPFSMHGFPMVRSDTSSATAPGGLLAWMACVVDDVLRRLHRKAASGSADHTDSIAERIAESVELALSERPMLEASLASAAKRMEQLDRMRSQPAKRDGGTWHAFRPYGAAAVKDEEEDENKPDGAKAFERFETKMKFLFADAKSLVLARVSTSPQLTFEAAVGLIRPAKRALLSSGQETTAKDDDGKDVRLVKVSKDALLKKLAGSHANAFPGLVATGADGVAKVTMNTMSAAVQDALVGLRMEPLMDWIVDPPPSSSRFLSKSLAGYVCKTLVPAVAKATFRKTRSVNEANRAAALDQGVLRDVLAMETSYADFPEVDPEICSVFIPRLVESVYEPFDFSFEAGHDPIAIYEVNLIYMYVILTVLASVEKGKVVSLEQTLLASDVDSKRWTNPLVRRLLSSLSEDVFRIDGSNIIDNVENIRKTLEDQREASKNSKIAKMDKLDSSTRVLLKMFNDTFGDTGEWDELADQSDDEDAYEERPSTETNQIKMDNDYRDDDRDDDKADDKDGDGDFTGLVDHDYDEDEIDEDVY